MHTPVIPAHRHGIEGGAISLQPPDLNRPSLGSYLRSAGLAFLVCLALAWTLTGRHVDRKAEQTLAEADRKLQENMSEIASGLQRNLNVYHGIPASIGRDETIRRLLAAFPPEARPSTLPYAERRATWSQDPALAALSRSLAKHVQDIPAFSTLWALNAGGDCVAASNANTAESFVGTNYADREYFLAARQGKLGRQFAVGRRTNIPGLFFSASVFAGERFLGAVVSKIDLPYLASWVNQKNAFITDLYGVIILAQDKSLEMQALPGATVGRLSPAQRSARYKKESVPEPSVAPWDSLRYPALRRLGNDDTPLLLASRQIPEEDLTVTVMQAVPSMATLAQDRIRLFLLSSLVGALLLGAIAGALYYMNDQQWTRRDQEHRVHVEYLATHDALTGLFGRAVMESMITQGIAVAERSGCKLGVIFIDLDLFKDINDSMGHETGDLILREVASRLRAAVRASDVVVRPGGDEFVVLLNDIDALGNIAHLAGAILETLRQPYLVQGRSLNLSASLGIALYPDDGDNASALLRNADSAMYRAKENGRADFCFFHPDMHAAAIARLSLENELREALQRREFALHYQPQFSLSRQCVVGCEALVRWQHPTRGLILPGAFITSAEKSGLIIALGDWVLEAACRQAETWRSAGLLNFPVAVNLSAIQFHKPGLVQSVERALSSSGLPAGHLELELTESAVMGDTERAMQTLQSLKMLGVRLAIDDFGTGYSSLAYLKVFAPDVLKIDRSFVRDIETDENDLAIIRAIINLAQSLGYRVIAEGVETESQLHRLAGLGCDEIQGYWYSRPLAADVCTDFLRAQQASS